MVETKQTPSSVFPEGLSSKDRWYNYRKTLDETGTTGSGPEGKEILGSGDSELWGPTQRLSSDLREGDPSGEWIRTRHGREGGTGEETRCVVSYHDVPVLEVL